VDYSLTEAIVVENEKITILSSLLLPHTHPFNPALRDRPSIALKDELLA
jgi:hypothetical protein